MKIQKLRDDLTLPTKAYEGDAGFDIYAPESGVLTAKTSTQVKLGFAIEIEPDEVCIMSERSGMAIKHNITSIGNIVDSGYRGEVSIILSNLTNADFTYVKGEKIGQMIITKLGNQIMTVVEALSESQRGGNAHYSSGK